MSKAAGFVDWPGLLTDIAEEVGLQIDREQDLISVAQFHVNQTASRATLTRRIVEEFVEDIDTTENHRILARLPISTYWTTNYDRLIENALEANGKRPDVKFEDDHIFTTRPKRDAVVYKMHGDVGSPSKATLTKEDYEAYYFKHDAFISALTGDLTTKTFLFIGFSFTDPNLDYVLSRLNARHRAHRRSHYCFVRRPKLGEKENLIQVDLDYNLRRLELKVGELKRYGVQALVIDDYSEITDVLREIENRFRKRTVFISGSAHTYGDWEQTQAHGFIHKLGKGLALEGYRVVNGFGWGVGSAVINGVLEAVAEQPRRVSDEQLIMKPFPQFKTGDKDLPELWTEYRHRMISTAGVAIFLFGNKLVDDSPVPANGVLQEFEIALERGVVPIPVASTGFVSNEIFQRVSDDPEKYYPIDETVIKGLAEIAELKPTDADEIVSRVIQIVRSVSK